MLGVIWLACAATQRATTASPDCVVGEIDDAGTCVPEACGLGPWGTITGADMYVDAAGRPGGTGTMDAPFTSIQAGAFSVGLLGGGTLAVAAGDYAEQLDFDDFIDGVQIVGRCRERVVIDGSGGEGASTVTLTRDRQLAIGISGLTITGVDRGGITVDGARLTLTDVEIRDATAMGLGVTRGGHADLAGVTILRTATGDRSAIANAMEIVAGAEVVAEDVVIDAAAAFGIAMIDSNSSLDATRLTITGTQGESGISGAGIVVDSGARATLQNALIEDNVWGAVLSQSGGDADITDSVLRGNFGFGAASINGDGLLTLRGVEILDSRPANDASPGNGVLAQLGGQLDIRGCHMSGNGSAAIRASSPGSGIVVDDTLVEDTLDVDGRGGWGLSMIDGSSVWISNSEIRGNVGVGAFADGLDTRLDLTGVVIAATASLGTQEAGVGVVVQNGAQLTATDLTITDSHLIGLYLQDADTVATVAASRIDRTLMTPRYTGAAGVVVSSRTRLEARDLTISGTDGVGVVVLRFGEARCIDCTLVGNAFAGAVVTGSTLTLEGGLMSANGPHVGLGGGVGLYATDIDGPWSVAVDGTSFDSHPLSALWLAGIGSTVIDNADIAGGTGFSPREGIDMHGNALYAVDNSSPNDLILRTSLLHASATSAVLLDGAHATLLDNTWEDNPVDLVKQRCVGDEVEDDYADAPTTDWCPTTTQLVLSLDFSTYLADLDLSEE